MDYVETLPDEIFSRHVESYWKVDDAHCIDSLKLLLPTCTFNIIFVGDSFELYDKSAQRYVRQSAGAYFVGQTSSILEFKYEQSIRIIGIRFKPFAFANIIKRPLCLLNDTIAPLDDVIGYDDALYETIIEDVTSQDCLTSAKPLLDQMLDRLFYKSTILDERLRSQLNYILDRQGDVRVGELLDKYSVSKVTLHKHFVQKVGLTPKKVTQIWRMNRFLQLKKDNPDYNLTHTSLEAGYYDQSHFIKEFKSIFTSSPKKFFDQGASIVNIAHQNISRRFSNVYDPRIF